MLAEAEDEKSSAFVISQEDIDSVLQRGSGFQNGKYRIYRQFQKNEDGKSNIDFLKKSTAQAAVRIISQTVRRDTLGTTGKALRLKSAAHL